MTYLFCCLFFFLSSSVMAMTENPPLCRGKNALLSIVDRPSAADSACLVPYGKKVLEAGIQYQTLPWGHTVKTPSGTVRIGLPSLNEIFILPPDYYRASLSPKIGFGSTTIGVKHGTLSGKTWIFTTEFLITPSSGSQYFGNAATNASLSGIFTWNITDILGITAMLSGATQTMPTALGGERYDSINPDLLLSFTKHHFQWYIEAYGQTHTAFKMSSGYNLDSGLLYLFKPNVVIDAEIATRLSGNLGGFKHYIGSGMTVML